MSNFTRLHWTAFAVMAIGLAAPRVSKASFVVAPNNLADVEGNTNNVSPFFDVNNSSQRYQQLYAASQFASTGGPVLITQIAFRPNDSVVSFPTRTLPNIQIDLSTTNATTTTLSTIFANNVGSNNTVVFSGPLTLSSANVDADGLPGGPKEFDILISLQTPFLYDPAAGNLLFDVRNFFVVFISTLDASSVAGGPIARVLSTTGVDAASGFGPNNLGLVTRFEVTAVAVPLPASFFLAATGALTLCGFGWFRQKCNVQVRPS